MKITSSSLRQNDGFTIIELAIVMIIIGLIISGANTIFTPSMKQAIKNKNETVIRHGVDALVGFAGAHKQLPANFTEAVNSKVDAQNNSLLYGYDANLAVQNSVCNRSSTNLTIQILKADNTEKFKIANVAFWLWSKGYDGVSTITPSTPYENAISVNTTVPIVNFEIPVYSDAVGAIKDDLVGWATLSELKAAAECGRVLNIHVDSLPVGKADGLTNYGTSKFSATGGVPSSYQWCVQSPAIFTGGLLNGNLNFYYGANNMTYTMSNRLSVEGTFNSSSCTPYYAADELHLTGQSSAESAFTTEDQGGPYDFIVFLKESDGNITNRRFSLYINE
ncbi:MAG: prepilin-type N-terminal cleavage/methylation domain-containing protein [Magnetococcus sp. DMHC-6]